METDTFYSFKKNILNLFSWNLLIVRLSTGVFKCTEFWGEGFLGSHVLSLLLFNCLTQNLFIIVLKLDPI